MRTLIVDLNNFSRYPTLSVGYLTAILRRQGLEVEVLSPLAKGVQGYPRLTQAKPWGAYLARLKHWSSVTPNALVRNLRSKAATMVRPGGEEDRKIILDYARELIDRNTPAVVLISAYTMYYDVCAEISELCRSRNIPVIIGGNYFVEPEINKRWTAIKGVAAVFSGEPEAQLGEIVTALAEGRDISAYPGISLPGKAPAAPAAPFGTLDQLPFTDYSDFPWELYPNRIIPIMTGRGCGWGACTFCSDVITSAGRTFRTRSIENVLEEIKFQSTRFDAELFVFLDLKLNSDLTLWRALISQIRDVVPGVRWTASVHADNRSDNGLSREDLQQAFDSGLSRITLGLESASPRILKKMAKGTDPQALSRFLKDAHSVGLSVRMTSIVGYPEEEPEDIMETARFLEEHSAYVERIVMNRLTLMSGSRLERSIAEQPEKFPDIRIGELDLSSGVVAHQNSVVQTKAHRAAVYRLIEAIHRINRRPLNNSAREFEGVM